MKILITGGAGLVGSHCAEHFAREGHKVVALDNLSRSRIFSSKRKTVEYNWKFLSGLKNIILVKEDIRRPDQIKAVFRKHVPDVVIHTASQPGVRASLIDPYADFTINAAGTVNVLEALRCVNPRGTFLYCSTNKVYGDNVNGLAVEKLGRRYAFRGRRGIDEKFSIDQTGHTPYGVSKLTGDLYVQDYAHTYGLKTGVFRMSCIYGTRQFAFEDHGWISWFALRALKGETITICGDGKQVRDVLWVDDLVDAFGRFVRSPLRHGVFNMGGGPRNTMSLLELVSYLEDLTGRKVRVKFSDWRKFDQKVYVSDISRAEKVLKWTPTVSPREGVARIVSWIEGNRRLFV